jgi:hypothetical protein
MSVGRSKVKRRTLYACGAVYRLNSIEDHGLPVIAQHDLTNSMLFDVPETRVWTNRP